MSLCVLFSLDLIALSLQTSVYAEGFISHLLRFGRQAFLPSKPIATIAGPVTRQSRAERKVPQHQTRHGNRARCRPWSNRAPLTLVLTASAVVSQMPSTAMTLAMENVKMPSPSAGWVGEQVCST